MRIIYSCPGAMLQVYYDLHQELSKRFNIEDVGFYVSEKQYFDNFCKANPEFTSNYKYLAEWEVLDKISDQYDIEKLSSYQKKYFSEYSMWYSMVADRRIFLGKYTKIKQDHQPSYSYEQMMSLLENSIVMTEDFFEQIKPDIVVGLTSATFGDHIIFGMAESLGIRFMNLRHTKLKNYMTYTVGLDEKYSHVSKMCELLEKQAVEVKANVNEEVESYISAAQSGKVAYSGHRKFEMKWQSLLPGMITDGLRALLVDVKYLGKEKDHHTKALRTQLFLQDRLFRVVRLFHQEHKFKSIYKSIGDVSERKYIFFPMHAEPEVSLSVMAKNYQNQIEVVRNIAMQLPIEYKLLVKDHPRNLGRRSTKYLQKVLQIPNVDLVEPSANSIDIIRQCDMSIILSGFVGFEAVLQKKPVITLGKTMLSLLPDGMVKHVSNITDLRVEMLNILKNYEYDHRALHNYLYSIMSQSVPIDLMSVLLRKKGREGKLYTKELYEQNITNLANNLIQRIDNGSTGTEGFLHAEY